MPHVQEFCPQNLEGPGRPSGPPKIAVIGAGYWGKNLIRNFAELGALRSIIDADAAAAQRLADAHGALVQDFDEALSDEAVEAVVIATPAAQHAAMVERALAAGRHVFVEKPMALDATEGRRLVDRAAEAGRVLMVGHLLQYHPAFLELKRRVQGGEIGQLRYVYSNRMSLGQFRQEENALWSFAPHDISMILALTQQMPTTVQALGHSYLTPSVADVTHTHLSFANGVNAHILVSWLHPFKDHKMVVIGDRAMIVFDDTQPWESKLRLYRHGVEWRDVRPFPIKAEGQAIALEAAEPLRLECEHFLSAIRGGEVRTDGEEGLRVLRVLAAAQTSIDEKRSVDIGKESVGRLDGTKIHESAYVGRTARIGAGTKVWHFSHIMDGVVIGRDCSFGQNVVVGPDVTVGDGCKVQNNVSIYKGVTLGDGVFCGPSCVFTNVLTPRAEINRQGEFLPTPVGRGASIGANATIVCGHALGEYCMVAAGAVVTRDVPAFALMAGVPARRIGWVSRAGERLGDDLVCPRTGERYELAAPEELRPAAPLKAEAC